MADGKLIFPVKFDLQSAVKEAQGDVDAVLRRLETQINSRPLKIKIDGGFTNMGVIGSIKESMEAALNAQQMMAKDGSIKAMRTEMSALITEWEKLSEKERTATDANGKFAGRAGEIVKRFAELTAAANTHARSLNQLVSAADKATAAEEKAAKKRAETATRLAALKNPNMDSLTEVKASLKYYEQLAGSARQFSAGWEICIQRIKELKTRSQELSDIYKTMTRQSVYNMPEGNLNEVRDKIKALKTQMEQATPNSTAWNDFANQMSRLREVEKGMVAEQKEAIKTESELRAEKTKAANEELANQRKIKAERTKNVSDVERERAMRQQLISQKRQELAVLNGEERSLDQVNAKLAIRKRLLESSRQGTSFYDNNFKEVQRLEEKQRDMTSRLPEAQRKEQEALNKALIEEAAKRAEIYNRKRQQEAEDLAAQQRKAAEEARIKAESQARAQQENEARKRILNEQRLSYDTLIQKIQMLEAARNKTDIGAARWQRLTNEINKAKESLKVITDEMDKAAKRSERLARLREIIAMSERSAAGLNARLQEHLAVLQKMDSGTTASADAFVRQGLKVARLSEELQRVNQYMADFQQKALQGVRGDLAKSAINNLRALRDEITRIDSQLNNHRQSVTSGRGGTMSEQQVNQLLDQRIAKQKEINEITKTAEQQQAEYERKITEEKRKQAALAQKQQVRQSQKSLLASQSKDIDTLTKKLQYYQNLLNRLDFNAKPGTFTRVAKEVERLTKELDNARVKMAALTGQSTSGTSTQARNARKVNEEYSKQLGYIDRLIRRMAVYGSVGMIGQFLTKVREVTAQFELQRISLGAILQDQNKANQLFSEIKSFALKSPVSILDLTKYTKQLAAYRIGYDELFETTKKLTDVSVGLGVSMDRVVLAYGQVRATGHLRASEIRQFTEMGVPIVEELAAKLSKLNGETVTAAQVMDMVSKRAISFEMVKDVFDDMTSAGGIFYNMQEKQGNTLYGLWAKLGDAASVMYSEIGNTGIINDGMKSLISGLTSLMKNWRLVGAEVMVAVASFGAYKAVQALTSVNIQASTKATQRLMAAQNQLTAAQNRLTAAQRLGNKAAIQRAQTAVLEAQWTIKAATANRLAANATNVWTAAKYRLIAATSQLKAMVAGNWIMLTVAAIAAIGVAIGGAIEKATRLKRALDDIQAATINLQNQSVGRFEHLAEEAVNAADGSKKQRDALAELSRTYGDILPQDALKLENLKKMNHHYAELTTTLKEYIAVQQKNKGMEEISNEYGGKINDASKKSIDSLVEYAGVERDVAINIVGEMQRDIQEKLEKGETDFRTTGQKLQAAADKYGVKISDSLATSMTSQSWYDNWYDYIGLGKVTNEFQALTDAVAGQYNKLDEWNKRVDASTGATGAWSKEMEAAKKKIDELTLTNPDGSPIDSSTFQGSQIKANETMKVVADLINNDTQIKEAIKNKEVEWNEGWIHLVGSVDSDNLMDITTVNFDAIIEALNVKHPELAEKIKAIQKEWGNVAPTNATVVQIKAKMGQISDAFGVHMDKMQKYLWDGSGSVDDYLKRLKDQQAELNARLKEKQQQLLNMGVLSKWWNKLLGNDIEAEVKQMEKEVKALDTLIPFVTGYTVPEKSENKRSKGSKSDTRLQELQEINQTLEKINKEYDDLSKKEGKSKALADIKKQFNDTLNYTNKLGKKFGLHFDYPTEFKSLQQYRREILEVMKSLKNLKGGEKTILEFETMIGKADSDDLQKQIEQQLKEIAERISRAKVADEFYRKILSVTGDYSLAGQVAESIFGQDGRKLNSVLAEQVRSMTNGLKLPNGIISPDNIINYKKLREWAEVNKEELGDMYKELVKISENGQKDLAKSYEGYLKDLEVAKTYADKRVELARTTAEKIRDIDEQVKAGNYTKEQGENLKRGYMERETREEAKLEWDAFKDMPIYVQMFEDLEHASTSTLTVMKNHLTGLKGLWGSALEPTQLKEIADRIDEIENQLETRNPWKMLRESWFKYRDALKSYDPDEAVRNVGKASENYYKALADYGKGSAQAKIAGQELGVQKKILEISRQLTGENGKRLRGTKALDKANQLAYRNQLIAQQGLNDALEDEQDAITKYGKDSDQYKDAHAVVEEKKAELDIAVKVSQTTQENADTATKWKDSMKGAVSEIIKYMTMASDAARSIADLTEAFGGDEEDVQFWNDIGDALGNITAGFEDLAKNILSLNITGIISSAITAVPKILIGFMDLFSAGRIRKANKEIKQQEELLKQLEYSYDRLNNAADKLFGADWLRNQNRQLELLEAEARAKQKQAEAERSKGKKEDEEKTKQYLEEARDIRDQIADMEGSISEKMFGSDLASTARDFAQAWLDAYKEFGNTADAMSEKFHEMIQNMIVESLLSKVMEHALKPAFDMIDNMSDSDFYSESFWKDLMQTAEQGAQNADHGAGVVMDWVEKMGFSVRDMGGEFSGIAKDIAGATSEEINSVAAIGNTLMYYVSPIPRIDENVARIVAIMQGGGTVGIASGAAYTPSDYTGLLTTANEHLSSLPRMEQHLAEIHTMLGRIIVTRGAYAGINTYMKS